MADQSNDETSIFSRPSIYTDEDRSVGSKDENETTMATTMLIDEDVGLESEKRSTLDETQEVVAEGGDDAVKESLSTSAKEDSSGGSVVMIGGNDISKQPPGKKNLNEPTLKVVQTYLLTGDFLNEPLEYEEVAAFDLKIHRYTDERTRLRQGLVFSNTTNRGSPVDTDTAEERLYDQVYEEEEFHAVAVDFTKTVAAEASDMAGSSFIMNTKTFNWLKKAAGLQRAYDPYGPPQTQPPQHQLFKPIDPQHQNQSYSQTSNYTFPDDSDDGEVEAPVEGTDENGGAPSRLTRRRVRMTRKRRRQERIEKETEGLRILSEVVQELEKELKSSMGLQGKGRNSDRAGSLPVSDMGRDDDMDKLSLMKYDIGGPPGRLAKRSSSSLERKDLLCTETLNEFNDSLSFSMTDWIERLRIAETGVNPEVVQYATQEEEIPPALTKLGLEFRPRPVTIEEKEVRPEKEEENFIGKFQANVYASNCKIMLNALRTGARDWAIHEFFYSNIDRDWYRHDGIASDLARLKLPITSSSKLTRTEWSLVRRKVRRRPRLFSKRFIVEQIRRRNRYRSLIRQLQQDPKLPEFSALPEGSLVTAYNKRFRTILKGKILLHDPRTHEYLVQFESPTYGYEMCPDFEVACAGSEEYPPSPLFEPCPFLSYDGLRMKELVLANENGAPKTELEDVELEEIEREILLRLVIVIKEAFDRKKAILAALHLCADTQETSKGDVTMWLGSNLNQVNDSIEAAILHLQVMYGKMYGSPESLKQAWKIRSNGRKLPKEVIYDPSFKEWLESLTAVSTIIGGVDEVNMDRSSNKKSDCLQQNSSTWVGMLLLVNYLTEFAFVDDQKSPSTLSNGALDTALKNAFDQFANKILPSKMENELSELELENESRLEKALMELGGAVGMLRAEVAVGWGKDGVIPEILTI